MLAALSVHTLKSLPGRICGRSQSSLIHVLLRTAIFSLYDRNLATIAFLALCTRSVRISSAIPIPSWITSFTFFSTVLPGFRTSPYRFKAKEKKIVTSALIVVVVALVGEIVDGVLEVLVLRPKRLAL